MDFRSNIQFKRQTGLIPAACISTLLLFSHAAHADTSYAFNFNLNLPNATPSGAINILGIDNNDEVFGNYFNGVVYTSRSGVGNGHVQAGFFGSNALDYSSQPANPVAAFMSGPLTSITGVNSSGQVVGSYGFSREGSWFYTAPVVIRSRSSHFYRL